MRPHDDDLSSWRAEPVVRALLAPGTPAELAGEADALAGFRAAVPVRPRRRYLGRVGVGGSAVAVAVALSGGVAAAYTSSLPAPFQSVAHSVLGVIDVPAAHKNPPKVSGNGSHPLPGVSDTPAPGGSSGTPNPSPVPSGTHHPLAGHPRAGHTRRGPHPRSTSTPSPSPSTSPSPSPTPTPTPSVTATPPARVPGSITIALSAGSIQVGGTVAVSGRIATSSGTAIPGHRVWLLEQAAGGQGLSRVASGTTNSAGTVVLDSPELTSNARFRLTVGPHATSAALDVVVVPSLTASASASGSAYAIQVESTGGRPGDAVLLEVRRSGAWQQVGSSRLDASATADFRVPPSRARATHYRAVLPSTAWHGSAVANVTVPGAGAPSR